jgi:heat shock protein HslJ
MTDEELDRMLRAVGARWRDANPAVATVDPTAVESDIFDLQYDDDLLPPPIPRRPLWPWLVGAAAALLLAIGVAALVRPTIEHAPTTPSTATADVPYGDWVLVQFGTRDNGFQVTSEPAVGQKNLQIKQGKSSSGAGSSIVADLGCGTTSGTVDVSHNGTATSGELSLGALATTAIGCPNQPPTEADMSTSLNYVFAGQSTAYPHVATWSYDGRNLVITAAPVTLTYAPASKPAPITPALLGTSWMLSNFTNTRDVTSSIVSGAWLKIDANGVVLGNDGCNAIDTTADVTGSAPSPSGDASGLVVFHSGSFTQVSCVSAKVYDGVLFEAGGAAANGPASWQIYGGMKLALWRKGAGMLVFVAADSPSPLTATPWRLSRFTDANGHSSTAVGEGALQVATDGTVTGSDGCNALNAIATVSAGAVISASDGSGIVIFAPRGQTDIGCPSAVTFDGILYSTSGTAHWHVSGGTLTIVREGFGTLEFDAGAPSVSSTSAPVS